MCVASNRYTSYTTGVFQFIGLLRDLILYVSSLSSQKKRWIAGLSAKHKIIELLVANSCIAVEHIIEQKSKQDLLVNYSENSENNYFTIGFIRRVPGHLQ